MKALNIVPAKNTVQEILTARSYVETADGKGTATPQDEAGWFIRKLREQRKYRLTRDFIY